MILIKDMRSPQRDDASKLKQIAEEVFSDSSRYKIYGGTPGIVDVEILEEPEPRPYFRVYCQISAIDSFDPRADDDAIKLAKAYEDRLQKDFIVAKRLPQ